MMGCGEMSQPAVAVVDEEGMEKEGSISAWYFYSVGADKKSKGMIKEKRRLALNRGQAMVRVRTPTAETGSE